MKISINADYVLRAMYELAKNKSEEPISISILSERQRIPRKYLEKLFRRLKKNGIVRAIHGKKGGYILTDRPENITMKKIIRASEGDIKIHNCEERSLDSSCVNFEDCQFKNFWNEFNQHINSFLESHTLANFFDDK